MSHLTSMLMDFTTLPLQARGSSSAKPLALSLTLYNASLCCTPACTTRFSIPSLHRLQGEAPFVAAMSCGREMTASINPYSTASSAPMKKSLSVSYTTSRNHIRDTLLSGWCTCGESCSLWCTSWTQDAKHTQRRTKTSHHCNQGQIAAWNRYMQNEHCWRQLE